MKLMRPTFVSSCTASSDTQENDQGYFLEVQFPKHTVSKNCVRLIAEKNVIKCVKACKTFM